MDFENNIKVDQVIEAQVATADIDGDSVDMTSYRNLAFIVMLGESGDTLATDLKVELELEESDDDSTFSDVADADMTNTVSGTNDGCFAVVDAAAEDSTKFITEYTGSKRYVRPVVNVTGTHSNGIPVSAVALRSGGNDLPVSN